MVGDQAMRLPADISSGFCRRRDGGPVWESQPLKAWARVT
jgi:hypothetical protein